VSLSNILLIPGVGGDLQELRGLLFGNGQAGWMGFPSLDNTAISANTLGSGVQTFRDLYLGNNGTQGTADQRSAWGRVPKSGRRNIIGRPSEDLATWTFVNASGTASVTGNNVVFGASAVDRVISQAVTVVSGLQYTASITVSGSGQIRLFIIDGNGSTLTPLTITLTSTPTRYSLTATSVSSGGSAGLGIYNNASATPSSFTFVNAQFEQSSVMTPYQRRGATAFDITEPGQRDCYYLQPDGVNDGYVTGANLDLSGTDKVTVFAAVRKLSDAAAGVIAELSPSWATNSGAFSIQSASGTGANFASTSRGNAAFNANQVAIADSISAPATRILTGILSIGDDVNQLRVNGVLAASATGDQGSGNYRNDILYLFRRGGTTLPFNGQCFASIVAGGSYSTATIQRVEQILSKYTPGVTL
jgi:hypothetical protein